MEDAAFEQKGLGELAVLEKDREIDTTSTQVKLSSNPCVAYAHPEPADFTGTVNNDSPEAGGGEICWPASRGCMIQRNASACRSQKQTISGAPSRV
jgi:hypothetical protein